MEDLGFIKNCNNCKHNISFTEKDIEKEYTPIGYIVEYKPKGGCIYESPLCENAEMLAQFINELASPPVGSNCYCSGDKIHRILKVFNYKHYIKCPNCNEKILLEEGNFKSRSKYHNYRFKQGWEGWYHSPFFKETIWYEIDHNGEHNL